MVCINSPSTSSSYSLPLYKRGRDGGNGEGRRGVCRFNVLTKSVCINMTCLHKRAEQCSPILGWRFSFPLMSWNRQTSTERLQSRWEEEGGGKGAPVCSSLLLSGRGLVLKGDLMVTYFSQTECKQHEHGREGIGHRPLKHGKHH